MSKSPTYTQKHAKSIGGHVVVLERGETAHGRPERCTVCKSLVHITLANGWCRRCETYRVTKGAAWVWRMFG